MTIIVAYAHAGKENQDLNLNTTILNAQFYST